VSPLDIMGAPRKRSGHEHFTKIDIPMQHCAFELDDESQDLCTIVTPFGLCKCAKAPAMQS